MRTGTFFGRQVVMTNKSWKKCLGRVNAKKAKLHKFGREYRIVKACPFCTFYGRNCGKCPLDVFAPKNKVSYGCVRLFNFVCKNIKVKYCVTLHDGYVSWREADDKKARRILDAVYILLLKMKKRGRLV